MRALSASELRGRIGWALSAPPAVRRKAKRAGTVVAALLLLVLALGGAWLAGRGGFDRGGGWVASTSPLPEQALLPDQEPFLYRALPEAGRWDVVARHYLTTPNVPPVLRDHRFVFEASPLEEPGRHMMSATIATARSHALEDDGQLVETPNSLEGVMRGATMRCVVEPDGAFAEVEGLEASAKTPVLAYVEFLLGDFDWAPRREVSPGDSWKIVRSFHFAGQPSATAETAADVRFEGYVLVAGKRLARVSFERKWAVKNFNFGLPDEPHCLVARMEAVDAGWTLVDPATGFPSEARFETRYVANDDANNYVDVRMHDVATAKYEYR